MTMNHVSFDTRIPTRARRGCDLAILLADVRVAG